MLQKRKYLSPLIKYDVFSETDVIMFSGGNEFTIMGYSDDDFDLPI